MREHNLGTLLERGLLAMINSDDPAYFGGYLNENFRQVFAALPLELKHAKQLACNSFEAAFLDAERKSAYLAEVESYFSTVQ